MLTLPDKATSQAMVSLLHDKDFAKVLLYLEREVVNLAIKSTKRKDSIENRWIQGGSQALQELINEINNSKKRIMTNATRTIKH